MVARIGRRFFGGAACAVALAFLGCGQPLGLSGTGEAGDPDRTSVGGEGAAAPGAGFDDADAGAPEVPTGSSTAPTCKTPKIPGAPASSAGGSGVSGSTAGGNCSGKIASTTFLGALCTCRDANLKGYLRTRGFDSQKAPYDPAKDKFGGSVGINRRYVVADEGANAGFTDIGGSLAIAGGDSMAFNGALMTEGDFRTSGRIDVKGYTRIGRHAFVGGDVTNAGFATVEGDLRIAGRDMLPLVVSGARFTQAVSVAPPCACDVDDILPVEAIVSGIRAQNDNAKVGLPTGALAFVLGSKKVKLSCGVYYLDAIGGAGNIEIDVEGKVALAIGGELEPTGNFDIHLGSGAELDVFVGGRVRAVGRASFGDKARPYASRIYAATSEEVVLTGASEFVGNLYAPRARVRATGYLDVWGSVFALDFVAPGYASIVYDRAILTAGDTCDAPPPPSCNRCGSCGGGDACVNGKCGACRTDDDCCGQLVCQGGKCRPFLR
jgi:hypothetical protein